MKVSDQKKKWIGDEFETKLKEFIHRHPELEKEAQELTSSMQLWCFAVFWNLTKEQKEKKIKAVLESLDKDHVYWDE